MKSLYLKECMEKSVTEPISRYAKDTDSAEDCSNA